MSGNVSFDSESTKKIVREETNKFIDKSEKVTEDLSNKFSVTLALSLYNAVMKNIPLQGSWRIWLNERSKEMIQEYSDSMAESCTKSSHQIAKAVLNKSTDTSIDLSFSLKRWIISWVY